MTAALPNWPFQQPRPTGLELFSLNLDDYQVPCEASLPYEQWLDQALPPRRKEFAAGRACAAAALEALGHEPAWPPIARPYRYARFPVGVVGSISHTQSLAVACAADAQHFLSVGVDAERIAWNPELCPMAEHVMSTWELGQLEAMSPAQALRFFYLSFSAKEAFFKAVFPLCHTDMDFCEAELVSWDEAGRFRLRLTSARLADRFAIGQTFVGCWAVQDDTLVTLLTIGHEATCRAVQGGEQSAPANRVGEFL